MKKSQNLIWIDLEMTGLEPKHDRIIEIATIVTDSNLNILAEGPDIAIHHSQRVLDLMDEWNVKHHGESGLIQRVQESKITCKKAEAMTLEFLKQYVSPQKSPICGNSVWQDRRFLSKWMPELEKFFHYRQIDVSSFKEIALRWAPKTAKLFNKKSKHRALSDIRDSIDELKFYREKLFIGNRE
ncbi:MAG: oligoribonuclease [Pseudomonadota bacterium]|nr:oligoribonuclease [Gammaproteobacteria bacterium]MBU1926757.1 oligoribonuclease [Gammaproteobacteria bacterium]MBU2546265.1 oligoribonuclease [Gammaproteobacteria bacterium]